MIRSFEPDDIAEIAAIYNYYVRHTAVSFEEAAVSDEEMQRRFSKLEGAYPRLVAVEDDRIAGYAYASRWKERAAYRHTAETTVYLAKDFVGRGLGTQLYSRLLDELRDDGFHSAMGVIALPNSESEALHEKMGFIRAGLFREVGKKFEQWIDVAYWQLPLEKKPR